MNHLPFREVHLDFHTSEHIRDIGRDFQKEEFQKALQVGHVDAITLFAKCHHGWMYYPSKTFAPHPHLTRDLLGEMLDACREIGVTTQIYISAGWDEQAARIHPEWRARDKYPWSPVYPPAFTTLCFNTGYLDYLAAQVKETLTLYPAEGLSMDICVERICTCNKCRADMLAQGLDPDKDADAAVFARQVYRRYYTTINRVAKEVCPHVQIYHNGYIMRGRRDLVASNDYYQIEALPTGGWGYDLFPLTSSYAAQFRKDVLGMTGKFHTHWGEFGGYKTANALIYETALTLACGARCSVGDQLHPLGKMDEATYRLIGEAYARVEQREPWCQGAVPLADVGVMSQEAMQGVYNHPADIGAVRLLLEGHYLFRILDTQSDFTDLKLIILPDNAQLDDALASRLEEFVKGGGKLLASGASGLLDGKMAFELGCRYEGEDEYSPTYLDLDFAPDFPRCTAVVYGKRHRISVTGKTVACGYAPYFNRTPQHFCSHQHAPADPDSRSPGITCGRDGIYIGWDIFTEYKEYGSITTHKAVIAMIDRLLAGGESLRTSLPAQGVNTLTRQADAHRYVAHFLYASPVHRGGRIPASHNENIEIIEDILPLYDISVCVNIPEKIRSVRLVPEGVTLPFEECGGKLFFTIPKLWCHTMVELNCEGEEGDRNE